MQTSRYLSPTRKVRRSDHANTPLFSLFTERYFVGRALELACESELSTFEDIFLRSATLHRPSIHVGLDSFGLATSHQYSPTFYFVAP